jgi:hypothetical protein
MTDPPYGIIANSFERDRVFRNGAKVWLVGGTGGEGWHKFVWTGISRGGRVVTKWAPTERFHNFRAAWIPDHMKDNVWYFRGSREEMEYRAKELETFAASLRETMTNRRVNVRSG